MPGVRPQVVFLVESTTYKYPIRNSLKAVTYLTTATTTTTTTILHTASLEVPSIYISALIMISKTLLSLALFAACATIIMSSPQVVPIQVQNDVPQLPEGAKEEILEYIAEKMDQAFPNLAQEIQTRDFSSLFNLSAYINNANRPANTTALTLVPLITILSALG